MIIILNLLCQYCVEYKVDCLQLDLVLLVLLNFSDRLLVLILIENAYIATLHVLSEIASNGLNQLIHLRLRNPNDISGDIYLLAAEKLTGLIL